MMCNDVAHVRNGKRLFQQFVLFYLINLLHTKTLRRFDECHQFLVANDCYYFPCLDAHYPCGRESHLTKFSYDLCLLSTKKYVSKFNQNAQIYFNHTNTCVMKSIHNNLIEEKISAKFTCTNLQALVLDNYFTCFQNNDQMSQLRTGIDFCSIICDNLQAIMNLFLNLNNEFIEFYQLLIETGKSCGAQINESKILTMPALLISICLDRKNAHLKQDITSIMLNPRFELNEYDWISE